MNNYSLTIELSFYYNGCRFRMSFFKRLFYRFFRPNQTPPEPQGYALDAQVHASLQDLADQQQRSVDEVASDLLQHALQQREMDEVNWKIWTSLTPRQKQIAALTCSDFTNQEIALKLQISPQTVKSHVRLVLARFEVHSKSELRRRLAGWDFRDWLP